MYRSELVVGILDIRPVFHGHCLLVSRTHYETLADAPASLLEPLFRAVQITMDAMEAELGAQGTFVAVNNRISQSVPHLHVHVVPRRRKDGLRGFFWPRHPYPDDAALTRMRTRLRLAIAAAAERS